jgi:ATP-binding protein involved in chromosome partitioning
MASPLTQEKVLEALRSVIDPELRRDVVELRMTRGIQIEDGAVTVGIALTTPGCPLKANIADQVRRAVGELPGVTSVEVDFSFMTEDERAGLREQLRGGRQHRSPGIALPDTCRVIAVASGKGGVGKSTVTANLAVALARTGAEVGVMDADVYGYSIPHMLGIRQRPVTVDSMIVPPVNHDLRLMSIGFFLDEDEPVMWRGPMLHRALEQFLGDVHWGELDFLVVDMPPGTGDVAISLAQLLPRAEVVVVTTPQAAAQSVAARSAAMAQKLDQRVIGVIENMSDAPGAPSVFGRGGGSDLAQRLEVPLLATVPLDATVREGGDAGIPVATGDAPQAVPFSEAAAAILAMDPPAGPPPAPKDRIKKPLAMI